MLINQVKRLVSLGLLEHKNDSEWGAPYFAKPKSKTKWVIFMSNLRHLNRQLDSKTYSMPKIREMLLKLEGLNILCQWI